MSAHNRNLVLYIVAAVNALFLVGLIWAWAFGLAERDEWAAVGVLHFFIGFGCLAAADLMEKP